MENATKALIIAGSILVAILLVTMGISLLSSTGALQDQQDQLQNSLNMSGFNDTIEEAKGNNVQGSKLKGTLQQIYSKMLDTEDKLELTINYTDPKNSGNNVKDAKTAVTVDTIINKIEDSYRYKVLLTKNPETGYYNQIDITKK